MQKFALKRLTASDLTFFKWHFENNNAGNQKAINLSRSVFIDVLYPSLPDIIADRGDGKIPLTMYTYGPGLAEGYPLQRKIVKSGSYKNWRLNGEFVFTPDDTPERFKALKPGDIAIMGFEGASFPTALHMDYLAGELEEDRALRDAADLIIGNPRSGMKEISLEELTALVERINPAENHPVRRLIVDADIVEAVQGDAQARLRVFRRTGRSMSQDELRSARQKAEDTGEYGETLVAGYLESKLEPGLLESYEWTSRQNAVAPYDFKLVEKAGAVTLLDVKSTTSDFSAPLHISMAEVVTMATAQERYDIYRIYSLTEEGAKLRIASDVRTFAQRILKVFETLPMGVRVDGISVAPDQLPFDNEQVLSLPDEED